MIDSIHFDLSQNYRHTVTRHTFEEEEIFFLLW